MGEYSFLSWEHQYDVHTHLEESKILAIVQLEEGGLGVARAEAMVFEAHIKRGTELESQWLEAFPSLSVEAQDAAAVTLASEGVT